MGWGVGGGGGYRVFLPSFLFPSKPSGDRDECGGLCPSRLVVSLFIYLFIKKKDKNVTLASFALNFVEKNSFFLLIFARFNNLLRNGIWLLGVVLFQPFFLRERNDFRLKNFVSFFGDIFWYFWNFSTRPWTFPFCFSPLFFLREKDNDFRSRNAVIGFYF